MFTRLVPGLALAWALIDGAVAAAAGDGHAGGGLNPLDFKADLALWTAVVFLLLLGVLGPTAWRRIVQALDEREKHIDGQIASAEKANAEAKRLLADYEQRLANAEAEVREILERGRREAEALSRRILDETREESRRERERALREIEAATDDALRELVERSADLAVELAAKIVQAKLDRAQHARLIEQAVANFGNAPLSRRGPARG